MDDYLEVACGRRVERVSGSVFRAWTCGFTKTVLEIGTGDGRWFYRQARAHPERAHVGVDANADRMREVSFRAGRKPSRGGIGNLLFVRASIERLPQALDDAADEIYILYPWGTLLDGVWTPQPEALAAIAQLAKPGGRLEVHLNASAIMTRMPDLGAMASGYAAGGIRLDGIDTAALSHSRRSGTGYAAPPQTSWARRLAHGRDMQVMVLRGTVER